MDDSQKEGVTFLICFRKMGYPKKGGDPSLEETMLNLFKEVRDQASLTNLSQGWGIFEPGNNPDISLDLTQDYTSTKTCWEKQTKNVSFLHLSDYLI